MKKNKFFIKFMGSKNIQTPFVSSVESNDFFLKLSHSVIKNHPPITLIRSLKEDKKAVEQINQAFCKPIKTLDKIVCFIQDIWDRCVALFSSKRRQIVAARDLLAHPTVNLTQSLQFLSEVKQIFNQSNQDPPDLLEMSLEGFKESIESFGELERKTLDSVCCQYALTLSYPFFNHLDSSVVELFQMAQKSVICFQQALKTVETDLAEGRLKASFGDAESRAFIIWVTNHLKRFGVQDPESITFCYWAQNRQSVFIEKLTVQFAAVARQIVNGESGEKALEALHLEIKNRSEVIGHILNQSPIEMHRSLLKQLNNQEQFQTALLSVQQAIRTVVHESQTPSILAKGTLKKILSAQNRIRTIEQQFPFPLSDRIQGEKALVLLSKSLKMGQLHPAFQEKPLEITPEERALFQEIIDQEESEPYLDYLEMAIDSIGKVSRKWNQIKEKVRALFQPPAVSAQLDPIAKKAQIFEKLKQIRTKALEDFLLINTELTHLFNGSLVEQGKAKAQKALRHLRLINQLIGETHNNLRVEINDHPIQTIAKGLQKELLDMIDTLLGLNGGGVSPTLLFCLLSYLGPKEQREIFDGWYYDLKPAFQVETIKISKNQKEPLCLSPSHLLCFYTFKKTTDADLRIQSLKLRAPQIHYANHRFK